MYVSDGVELSESEFRLLRDLVDADSKGGFREFVNSDLWMDAPIHLAPSEERAPVYKALSEKGLLSAKESYGVVFPTGLTYLGRDWVADYYASKRTMAAELRKRSLHDWAVNIVTAIVSFLLGMLVEYVRSGMQRP